MASSITDVRVQILIWSLAAIGVVFGFFLVAPYVGIDALREDPWRIPQIILPVFIGYLAGATQFLFTQGPEISLRPRAKRLLPILVNGVFVVFAVLSILLLAVFAL